MAGTIAASKKKKAPVLGMGGLTIAGPIVASAPGGVRGFQVWDNGNVTMDACVTVVNAGGNPFDVVVSGSGQPLKTLAPREAFAQCAATISGLQVSCPGLQNTCSVRYRVDLVH